ncbi:ABC transporter ATP-binding protein [Plantactinospora sp. KBS50]|uniref:ABC transporter ATP-binding protein n=1 Tax=Plantactinospora sp. KBS50 TaxID=2024580 RepID=UPI000BAB156D|nr:ABC transporter ATP-binding protein [Plantactinospora sp. KBS50]ASW56543.1 hypothetical protein CIK06_23855 [Plantactinospora sp. KBS50]
MSAVRAERLTRRYGNLTVLDGVSFALDEHRIHGLLGRNGAGKTTLMRVLTGQELPSSGLVTVYGRQPFENPAALSRLCFVREDQRYPDNYRVRHALAAARLCLPHWSEPLARSLVADFGLPLNRPAKKLSRGMLSALGVTIGLASRAPLTIFDEPYLGLDPVARQLFYDRLLADYAAHPRTVILATHLVDEVADLLEHVVLIDQGRLLLAADTETLRGQVRVLAGPAEAVARLADGRRSLRRERMAGMSRVTVRGDWSDADLAHAERLGVDVSAVSLQQAMVLIAGAVRSPAASDRPDDRPDGAAPPGSGPADLPGSGPAGLPAGADRRPGESESGARVAAGSTIEDAR